MARVTDVEVRVIIPNTSIAVLTPFIAVASLQVDSIAKGCAASLSDDQLKNVELYLSAHLVALSDQTVALNSEKFENAENVFQTGTFGEGVLSTNFGQTANALSNGCLAQAQKPQAQVCFA